MLGLDKGLTQGAASQMSGGPYDRTRDVLGPPFKLTIRVSVIAEPQKNFPFETQDTRSPSLSAKKEIWKFKRRLGG